VYRLEAGIQKTIGDFTETSETFFFQLVFPFPHRVAHDSDIFRTQALHSWDGALDFRQIEGVVDFLAPVGNGRSETVDTDSGVLEFLFHDIEGFLRNVMQVGLGKSGDFHGPGFDGVPSQFLDSFDLSIDERSGFIGDACENHGD